MNNEYIRKNKRENLKYFIINNFVDIINSEAKKYCDIENEFTFSAEEDSVFCALTNLHIEYSNLGWYQMNENESVKRISLECYAYNNGKYVGKHIIIGTADKNGNTFTIRGMKKICDKIKKSPILGNKVKTDGVNINDIIFEDNEEEANTDLIENISKNLNSRNVSKKRSIELATSVVKEHGDLEDIDILTDIAFDYM